MSVGNVNDSVFFEKQLMGIKLEKVRMLAERAYSTYEIIEKLREKRAEICIPPKSNMKTVWSYDKELYKSRNKIERFFNYLKDSRGIATRYEKLDENYMSFGYFSAIINWLK